MEQIKTGSFEIFRTELNANYSKLSWLIGRCKNKKNRLEIKYYFEECLDLISENIEYLRFLQHADLYMALNIIRLARSQGYQKYSSLYNSEIFLNLDECYSEHRQNR